MCFIGCSKVSLHKSRTATKREFGIACIAINQGPEKQTLFGSLRIRKSLQKVSKSRSHKLSISQVDKVDNALPFKWLSNERLLQLPKNIFSQKNI